MLTPSERGSSPPPPPTSSATLVGTLVAGKYRVKRVLGHGGMGTVYKAENQAIGRTVALKILHTHLADDGITLARFQREARVAASAGHEHVVEMLDMGVEPSGAPFIVMEYVRGRSLAKVLMTEAPLEIGRAARIAGQILSGLAAVHARGIVHRDLKPENVMLTVRHAQPDFVKLFDFGISTFTDAELEPTGTLDLTPTGRTMGTPFYASPEQIQGDRGRDARVDIYAVGVLLFEMLTGHRPFERANFPDLCRAIVEEPPPPLHVFRRDIPAGLDAVVRRALAKSPEVRFQSAREMRIALTPFGAAPVSEEPEPTDTFTLDMRELRAREELLRGPDGRIESSPPPAGPHEELRGDVVISLLEHVRGRVGGPRYQRLLDDVGVAASVARAPVDPMVWYDGSVLAILDECDRAFAANDRRTHADAGRALARRVIGKGAREALMRTQTPELFFAMAADVLQRHFAFGTAAKVTRVARGHGRLEIDRHLPASLGRSVLIVGFIDEALRMAGARDVDVRLSSSMALGDPTDVVEATWSS